MDTLKHTGPERSRKRGWQAGFSLVEVTIAIGIVSFAFVSVIGLIPTGLNTFHQAMDASVGTQIVQRVLNDLQQTDFTVLTQDATGVANETYRYTWTLSNNSQSKVRYFDDQGNEVTDPARAIYHVNTRIMPVTVTPSSGSQLAEASNTNLATVTVQVANNPSNQTLALSPAGSSDTNAPLRNLWTGAFQSNPSNTGVVPIVTYSMMVSKNK